MFRKDRIAKLASDIDTMLEAGTPDSLELAEHIDEFYYDVGVLTEILDEPMEFGSMAIDEDKDIWYRTRDGEVDGFPWVTEHSKMRWDKFGKYIVRTFPPMEADDLIRRLT